MWLSKEKRGRERKRGEKNRVTGRDIETEMENEALGQLGN